MKAKPRQRWSTLQIIVGLIASAVLLSVVSLAVRTSLPGYGPGGLPVHSRTMMLPDGQKVNFESKNFGWPIPYHITSCWGSSNACWPVRHTDWLLLCLNALAWFAIVTAVGAIYLRLRKPRR